MVSNIFPGGAFRFEGPEGYYSSPNGNPSTGESVIGGVQVLEQRPRKGPDVYDQAIPNHSMILNYREITTPIGPARVYTLERDAGVSSDARWWQQHVYIPVNGDRFYDIWVKIGLEDKDVGEPVPILAQIIAGFYLCVSESTDGHS